MKKIIILWLILFINIAFSSDIAGDTNNDGVLSGEEQYFLNNPVKPVNHKKQIETVNTLPVTTEQQPELSLIQHPTATTIERDAEGRIVRSEAAKDDFKNSNPCPSNGHHSGACPGYVIDHIMPLACGGEDDKSNMQWQTTAEGKAKDKWERKNCQLNKTSSAYKSGTVLYDSDKDSDRDTYYPDTSNSGYSSSSGGSGEIYTGSRGGKYTLSPNGNKEYIRNK